MSGESASRRTAKVLVAMMNDVLPFLNFTIELGEDFVDGKLPSLDINIWVEGGQILYEFFEKTMSTNLMVEAGSALSREVQLATLSAGSRARHQTFDDSVKRSCLDKDHPAFQPLFPKAGWRRDQRAREKALERSNWFKGKAEKEPWESLSPTPCGRVAKKRRAFQKAGGKNKLKAAATVIFVPSTRGSTLLKSLKEDEDKMAELTGFRVKYQEDGGSILANSFSKDLSSGQHCGREECPPCEKPEGRVNCKARNIIYESKCGRQS